MPDEEQRGPWCQVVVALIFAIEPTKANKYLPELGVCLMLDIYLLATSRKISVRSSKCFAAPGCYSAPQRPGGARLSLSLPWRGGLARTAFSLPHGLDLQAGPLGGCRSVRILYA